MITFTRSVGVAPGTTTMTIPSAPAVQRDGGLGIWQCPPSPRSLAVAPYHGGPPPAAPAPAAAKTKRWLDPYGSFYEMRGNVGLAGTSGLGIVLSPPELLRTMNGGPKYQEPFDPGYHHRGEDDLYFDTPWGEVPTDAEYGRDICYTPVKSAWIHTLNHGMVQPPWRPNYYSPSRRADGFFDANLGGSLGGVLGEATDTMTAMLDHQKKVFWLTAISTAAVVAVAAVNIVNSVRDYNRSK